MVEQKLQRRRMAQWLAADCILLIAIMVLTLICPGANKANATESFSTNVNTTATAHIPATLAVSLGNNASMTVTPSWNGTFTSSQTELSITTNNPTGYQIFLETADGSQNLNATKPENLQKITPIIGSASKNNFAGNVNRWGYALLKGTTANDNTTYTAVPIVGSDAIQSTNTSATNDIYSLSFAAIINAALPVDTYTNNVIVTVVVSPIVATVSSLSLDDDGKTTSDSETTSINVEVLEGENNEAE